MDSSSALELMRMHQSPDTVTQSSSLGAINVTKLATLCVVCVAK